jgi:hypothetical protein
LTFSLFVFSITLGLVCHSGLPRDAHAAVITWGAVTVSDDNDISTLGTLDRAINVGEITNSTINGVTFVSNGTGGSEGSFTFRTPL